ncbi:MAG: endonuclease VIII [Proteobacteria bacterium]|nr:endonuclease VIII [Pseudomonadota bacterium]
MPEGPEIRRVATRIHKVLAGREACEVQFTQPRVAAYGPRLSGHTVAWVSSRGKALLTHFDNGLTVYSHNQLYGRWYLTRRDKPPRTNRTLRLAIHTETHSALLFSASEIEVHTPETLLQQKYLSRLGPDALDDRVAWRDILHRLQDKKFAGRSLAALYLDQSFVAGIGNYLRSEILFKAKVNPFDRPKDLSRGQLGALARNTLELTRQAYATSGVTNSPARVKRLQTQGLSRRHYRHLVFDRQHADCYHCGGEIERIEVSSRRIYLCQACQPRQSDQLRPNKSAIGDER